MEQKKFLILQYNRDCEFRASLLYFNTLNEIKQKELRR
jgi:hypothetical protein